MSGLQGKVCLVTGANAGIGKETVRELARQGATVVMVSRDAERGQAALEEIQAQHRAASLALIQADLASQEQVRHLAAQFLARYARLDILIHNAGLLKRRRELTADGIETTLAVNHLAPFLLTHLLQETLRASAPARVITVASEAHKIGRIAWKNLQAERGYYGLRQYGVTKLMNILFSNALAERLQGTGVTSNSLHPGVVDTGIGREAPVWAGWFLRPVAISTTQGAATPLYVATAPELETVSGRYFKECKEAQPSPRARERATAEKLWEISARLTQLL